MMRRILAALLALAFISTGAVQAQQGIETLPLRALTNVVGHDASGVAGRAAIAPAYRGQVSNRSSLATQSLGSGTATWVQGKTKHYAYSQIVAPTVVYGNYWVNGSNVEIAGSAGTIKVALQQDCTGTPVLATENTSGPIAFPAGLTSLSFNVTIPAGSFYCLLPLVQSSGGVVVTSYSNGNTLLTNTDGFEYGTGTVGDKTGTGVVGTAQAGFSYGLFPNAVIAWTTRASSVIFGDSIAIAIFDNPSDIRGDRGYGRFVGQAMPYINLAVSSTSMANYLSASRAYRDALLNFGGAPIVTHGLNQLGTNELGDGAATMAGRRTSMSALYPGIIIGGATLTPRPASTSDSWATRANQATPNATIASFNTLVRAGIAGERFFLDPSDVLDVNRTGTWPVTRDFVATTGTANFATSDGLHPLQVIYERFADTLSGPVAARMVR